MFGNVWLESAEIYGWKCVEMYGWKCMENVCVGKYRINK